MINKIKFKNFKLFKNWQELEIKPITILIGKNNSGKTAVLKLPTLISGSLKGEFNDIIKLENDKVKIGSEYRDLVYNRVLKPGDTLDLKFYGGNDLSLEELNIKIDLPIDEIKNKPKLIKWIYSKNGEIFSKLDKSDLFKGFVKNPISFDNLALNIDYIEALRVKPDEEYSFDNSEIKKIGLKGENVYQILINDKIDSGEVLNQVSNWYSDNFENWSVEIIENQVYNSSKVKFLFTLSNRTLKNINIINTGQGISQVLPLITRSYMKDEKPVLIIIEEPESHLHPAAHGNLAQRFVESVMEDNNKRYLIETHSENFILRVQNLVADPDNSFTPNDINIYYVDYDEDKQESNLKKIVLQEDGEILDWPDNVFNENIDEVYRLRRYQKRRRENASFD